MLTFIITTSTKLASLSLFKDDIMLGNININVKKTHSSNILEQVNMLFEWTGTNIDDVKQVLISKGPGSFTGVRIAMALVKGLFAIADDVKIYGVSELDAIYYLSKEYADIVISGIDANKSKIYYNIYENGIKIKNDTVGYINELVDMYKNTDKKVLFAGDIANNYSSIIDNENFISIAKSRLMIDSRIYYELLKENLVSIESIETLAPYYLEKSQAEKEFKGGI